MFWDIDLIFGIWNYNDELQIKFSFCSHWIILAKLLSLDFIILHSIQINIHVGNIRVVPAHLVLSNSSNVPYTVFA